MTQNPKKCCRWRLGTALCTFGLLFVTYIGGGLLKPEAPPASLWQWMACLTLVVIPCLVYGSLLAGARR
jgi:hypothetical protein